MDKATREERRDISLQIWKLETERCEECVGYVPHGGAMHCKCATAAKIRALGDKLIAISARTRNNRLETYIKCAKEKGLTLELYTAIREMGVPIVKLRKSIGMTQAAMDEWRTTQVISKMESEPLEPVEVAPGKGMLAERAGLTLEDYQSARKLGYFDQDIREKYRISRDAMLDFKKRHGLALPRGHNSKYNSGKIPAGTLR